MSGIKISDANPFASAQDNDQFATERSGQSGSLTLKKIAEQAGISEGFLKGDPSGVFATNQTTNDKSQLDQKGLNIFGDTGETVNPDCTQNYCFNLQVDGDCTLDNPTNVPATNLGPFYFRLFAFTSDASSTLSFSGDMVKMFGSKPWDVLNENIIHCWYIPALDQTFYRIDNALALPGETQLAQGTITSAQILASNTSPVELIAAPGAGKFIQVDSVSYMLETGTNYATNIGAYFRHSDQTGSGGAGISLNGNGTTSTINSLFEDLNTATLENKSLIFETNTGDPTTGDFDIWYSIKYRIITYPF